jgi:hypothetical protein
MGLLCGVVTDLALNEVRSQLTVHVRCELLRYAYRKSHKIVQYRHTLSLTQLST